ncbi:hydrogenase formation protein HypD [Neptunomonas sp.]|uniref:hydrogenase formation protein HypD n=1 Tax=Neptunomonas sp. TaxID=1971898 RepID=UPI003566B74E
MKYMHEYRQADTIKQLADKIADVTSQPWTIMEVCGGQTNAIVKFGLQQFLPTHIELVHGPGCPVCVTPVDIIDKAIDIAARPNVIFCSFGDMLRVPGSAKDLQSVKAEGGDIRIVYSPMDALKLAQSHPDKEVVFLAIGFETTAPANAMAAYQARAKGITNFSLLTSQFLVPPAIEAMCQSPQSRIQGFLAAGHVCAIMGYESYPQLAEKYGVPIVVTGFEPLDILQGILLCVQQLEQGRSEVENQYSRVVTQQGNLPAQQMITEVFECQSQSWRGIGHIQQSGLKLREAFWPFDAGHKFGLRDRVSSANKTDDTTGCISGEIMQGLKKPCDCIHFAKKCRPESPIGAPMVSSEGACAAYYRYATSSQSATFNKRVTFKNRVTFKKRVTTETSEKTAKRRDQ